MALGGRDQLGPAPKKCTAHSKRTKLPCKSWCYPGAVVCRRHGAAAPQVKRMADRRVEKMIAAALDPDRVLTETARIAFSDIRDLFDDDGNIKPVKDWPEDFARAVAGVEVVKKNITAGDGEMDTVLKVRLWDKVVKLTNLMKYHGQLKEKLEVSGSVDLIDRLQAGRKRVASARG